MDLTSQDAIATTIILDILSDGKEWQGPALRQALGVRGIRQPIGYFVRQTHELERSGHIESLIIYKKRGYFGCKAKVFRITESGKAAHGSVDATCHQAGN